MRSRTIHRLSSFSLSWGVLARIVMIHDGRIFADGTPSEVLTKENIRTVYGVDADIIDMGERPHVILNDSVDR